MNRPQPRRLLRQCETTVEPIDPTKPYFSLATNRTFGTRENPRLWLDYRAVSSLDFRVYRINDPAKFFAQLSNPHQMGKQEEEQIATSLTRSPSLLERAPLSEALGLLGL